MAFASTTTPCHQQYRIARFPLDPGSPLDFNPHAFLAHACYPTQFKIFRQTPSLDGFDQATSFTGRGTQGPCDAGLGQPDELFNKGYMRVFKQEETEVLLLRISVFSVC